MCTYSYACSRETPSFSELECGQRLGVHAVRAADHRRAAMLPGAELQAREICSGWSTRDLCSPRVVDRTDSLPLVG